mmetsp:Transcript_20073/g.57614  ORF Transcript_20073/g.57614 Transcript_20073/m.57614 type:complete len:270 (+) Transcript_20073:792-1601(+)
MGHGITDDERLVAIGGNKRLPGGGRVHRPREAGDHGIDAHASISTFVSASSSPLVGQSHHLGKTRLGFDAISNEGIDPFHPSCALQGLSYSRDSLHEVGCRVGHNGIKSSLRAELEQPLAELIAKGTIVGAHISGPEGVGGIGIKGNDGNARIDRGPSDGFRYGRGVHDRHGQSVQNGRAVHMSIDQIVNGFGLELAGRVLVLWADVETRGAEGGGTGITTVAGGEEEGIVGRLGHEGVGTGASIGASGTGEFVDHCGSKARESSRSIL